MYNYPNQSNLHSKLVPKKPEPASAASLEKGEQGIQGGNISWLVGCEVAESYALAILSQYPLIILPWALWGFRYTHEKIFRVWQEY